MNSLIPRLVSVVLGLGGLLLAGWLLKLMGLDHGRWQSCTMFLPAILLTAGAVTLRKNGFRGYGVFILSSLFFIFGIVILFTG